MLIQVSLRDYASVLFLQPSFGANKHKMQICIGGKAAPRNKYIDLFRKKVVGRKQGCAQFEKIKEYKKGSVAQVVSKYSRGEVGFISTHVGDESRLQNSPSPYSACPRIRQEVQGWGHGGSIGV